MPNTVIVGIDEAGRGALAGPVVAGAVVLTPLVEAQPFIKDSKMLEPAAREEAYLWIEEHCTFGYGIVGPEVIDTEGILAANERAMQQAVAMVAKTITPTYLLIDGRDKFWFDYPHSSVVRGDQTEPCIAAGSIVAKVTRDRLMCKLAEEYPLFGFESHKGYGSPVHIEAIQKHGASAVHRKSFLGNVLDNSKGKTISI